MTPNIHGIEIFSHVDESKHEKLAILFASQMYEEDAIVIKHGEQVKLVPS